MGGQKGGIVGLGFRGDGSKRDAERTRESGDHFYARGRRNRRWKGRRTVHGFPTAFENGVQGREIAGVNGQRRRLFIYFPSNVGNGLYPCVCLVDKY